MEAATHVCDACLYGLDGPLQQRLGKIISLLVQVLVQVKLNTDQFK